MRRRAIAHELIEGYRESARRACGVVGCHRATFYYRTLGDISPREFAAQWPLDISIFIVGKAKREMWVV